MKNRFLLLTLLFTVARTAVGDNLSGDVKEAIHHFKQKDSSIQSFFTGALGYVVFPNIGKGGFIIGGAHGNGLVFERGRWIGKSSLTQATFGAQVGGQEFSEVIFFQTAEAFNSFKKGKFAVSAQVSAVVAAEGAAKTAKYQQGVAIFTLPKGGLMVEASVGGQKLSFDRK